MRKAMFGIAATLALSMSPAWAGDEKSDEKPTSDTVASRDGKSVSQGERERATARVIEARSDSGMIVQQSKDVRASHDERWLVEREGYRDGGY